MSTTDEATVTWLTQEAHDRLTAELATLIGNRREVAAEIHARREEGDLKENGGYHAAKEEQGKQELRIRQLEQLLQKAQVGDAPAEAKEAGVGVVVTVRFEGDDETETFLLGSREISATTDLTVYSPESALGAALIGKRVGDTATYAAPSGADITVTVLELAPFTG